MSSMRSASSTDHDLHAGQEQHAALEVVEQAPGVAIRTSTPRSSFFSWSSKDTPPISSAHESLVALGVVVEALGHLIGQFAGGAPEPGARGMRALARPAARRSIMGRVKAAVLPVPVWAMPQHVLAGQGDGMACGLNGVAVV